MLARWTPSAIWCVSEGDKKTKTNSFQEHGVEDVMAANILQVLGIMLTALVF